MKRRFVLACVLVGMLAAALVVLGSSAFDGGPAKPVPRRPAASAAPPAAGLSKRTPEQDDFAVVFQSWVDGGRARFGGAAIHVVDCVTGATYTHHFCAYIVAGKCRGGSLVDGANGIEIEQAGDVGIPASRCSARNSLKWIGANG
ncbi:MAG TPA: hypothetical protein VH816_06200 [Gaiellaceae bacterium]